MKNVYADPAEVFDTILDDEKIIARATSVTKHYDAFTQAADAYNHRGEGSMDDVKRKFYMAMMTVNILEGLRFYVSFACTFGFGELKLMEGSAKIISLIARDEAQHLALSTHVLKVVGTRQRRSRNGRRLLKSVKKMYMNCGANVF